MAKCSSDNQKVLFEDIMLGTRSIINLLCKPGLVQTSMPFKFVSMFQSGLPSYYLY